MKKSLFLALVFALLPIATLAQTSSPSPAVSIQPSPSPQATTTNTPDSTSVKISASGLELSGFPTWIIWVVLAVAVVAFVLWFFLVRSNKGPDWLAIGTVGIASILFLALMFLVGNWWGRSSARSELRELIGSRTGTIEVSAPQTAPTRQEDSGSSWPFYMVLMTFLLATGMEAAVFMYIYLRWGRRSWHRRDQSDRYWDFEDYLVRRLDSIDSRLR